MLVLRHRDAQSILSFEPKCKIVGADFVMYFLARPQLSHIFITFYVITGRMWPPRCLNRVESKDQSEILNVCG